MGSLEEGIKGEKKEFFPRNLKSKRVRFFAALKRTREAAGKMNSLDFFLLQTKKVKTEIFFVVLLTAKQDWITHQSLEEADLDSQRAIIFWEIAQISKEKQNQLIISQCLV